MDQYDNQFEINTISIRSLMKGKIVLASRSDQRKQILKDLGLSFKAVPADIDEHHSGFKKPHAIVKSIALRKAKALEDKYPDQWIIGCDTIVVLKNGKIAVKPLHKEDARQTLKLYSNSHCDVYSGLALINRKKGIQHVGFDKSRIYFKKLSKADIEWYLDTGDWKGRSGSLTIEGKRGWTKKIEGEYWNIVGLPVNLLKKMTSDLDV